MVVLIYLIFLGYSLILLRQVCLKSSYKFQLDRLRVNKALVYNFCTVPPVLCFFAPKYSCCQNIVSYWPSLLERT